MADNPDHPSSRNSEDPTNFEDPHIQSDFTSPHGDPARFCASKVLKPVPLTVNDCLRGIPQPQHSDGECSSFEAECPQPSFSECSSTTSVVTHATCEKPDLNMATLETHWTNAKHGSYLTFTEENFVENLYDRKYCAPDVCGQAPCHLDPSCSMPLLKFKFWRYGDWHHKSMPEWIYPTNALWSKLKSPWIDHFRHQIAAQCTHPIKSESVSSSPNIEEGDEVDSVPSTAASCTIEPCTGNPRIPRGLKASKMSMGPCQANNRRHGEIGNAVVAELLKQERVSEESSRPTTDSIKLSKLNKRGLQLESEQRLFTRHKVEVPTWHTRVEKAM